MIESRQSRRQRVLKGGKIYFDHAAIDCAVRNVSEAGAMLEIASPIGIPNNFSLVISQQALRRPCRVAWRSARRIGVRFD
jgi:hypothetical protein